MLVLTVLQPWAALIVTGVKTIETKSFDTNYRGDLLIYAGANKHTGKRRLSDYPFNKFIKDWTELSFGAIIGKVSLTATGSIERVQKYIKQKLDDEQAQLELALGDYVANKYGWLFENPESFEKPIFVNGETGLWDVEDKYLHS